MNYNIAVLTALMLCSGLAFAQVSPKKPGCAAGAASAPVKDCMEDSQMGMSKHAHGRWGAGYTPGWMLMTPAERKSFIQKMHAVKTMDECKALVDAQTQEVETPAKATGQHVPRKPRHAACGAFMQSHQHGQ